MRKHDEDQTSHTEKLEERTQRDQAQRSKQALSNQGSQDRQPADHGHGRGTTDHDSRDKPA